MENYTSDQPLEDGILNESSQFKGYASFWLRLAAMLIDGILVSVVFYIVIAIVFGATFFASGGMDALANDELPSEETMNTFFIAYFTLIGALIVANWLYFALMESSKYQGTLGKMAVKIKVADENGDPISFGRATGRHFGKIISGIIIYIGYIMAAFTEKKQALHDMMAGTLVLNK